jgi:hypothetical protein
MGSRFVVFIYQYLERDFKEYVEESAESTEIDVDVKE